MKATIVSTTLCAAAICLLDPCTAAASESTTMLRSASIIPTVTPASTVAATTTPATPSPSVPRIIGYDALLIETLQQIKTTYFKPICVKSITSYVHNTQYNYIDYQTQACRVQNDTQIGYCSGDVANCSSEPTLVVIESDPLFQYPSLATIDFGDHGR